MIFSTKVFGAQIMTDLSRLFATSVGPQMHHTVIKEKSLKPSFFSHTVETKPTSQWNPNNLEFCFNKNIKKTIDEKNLVSELNKFSGLQQKQFFSSLILFMICLELVSYSLNLDRRVSFHLFMLFVAAFLPSTGNYGLI